MTGRHPNARTMTAPRRTWVAGVPLVSRPRDIDPPAIEVPSGWLSQGGVLISDLKSGDGPYIKMADKWMVSENIRAMIIAQRDERRARGYFAATDEDTLGC